MSLKVKSTLAVPLEDTISGIKHMLSKNIFLTLLSTTVSAVLFVSTVGVVILLSGFEFIYGIKYSKIEDIFS